MGQHAPALSSSLGLPGTIIAGSDLAFRATFHRLSEGASCCQDFSCTRTNHALSREILNFLRTAFTILSPPGGSRVAADEMDLLSISEIWRDLRLRCAVAASALFAYPAPSHDIHVVLPAPANPSSK